MKIVSFILACKLKLYFASFNSFPLCSNQITSLIFVTTHESFEINSRQAQGVTKLTLVFHVINWNIDNENKCVYARYWTLSAHITIYLFYLFLFWTEMSGFRIWLYIFIFFFSRRPKFIFHSQILFTLFTLFSLIDAHTRNHPTTDKKRKKNVYIWMITTFSLLFFC